MVTAGNEPGGNMSRYLRHGSLGKTTDWRCYWTGCSKTEPTNIEWRQPLEGASNSRGAHDKAPHVSLPGTRRAMCTVSCSEAMGNKTRNAPSTWSDGSPPMMA